MPFDLKARRGLNDAAYRLRHRGAVLARKKRYRKAHKEVLNEKSRAYFKGWYEKNRYEKAGKEAQERLAAGVKPNVFPTTQETILRSLEWSVGRWGGVQHGKGGARKRYRQNGGRRAEKAMRRAVKLRATPAWADRKAIARLYAEARRTGMTVDHIVPLNSLFVCGLHVESNLRLLPPIDNATKSNRHWPQAWT